MTAPISTVRRKLLAAALLAPSASMFALPSLAATGDTQSTLKALQDLEAQTNGRLGLALLDASGNGLLQYRADERFAMCSTFKAMLAACVLQQGTNNAMLLSRRIDFSKRVLVPNSPVTAKHVGTGMTVQELCAATMDYSDNAAANLLLDAIGGPDALNAYARSIGDQDFYQVHYETRLGNALPGNKDDTTTPQAMAKSLHRLLLGDALPAPQRDQLLAWMRANTTGAKRIRAGVPSAWLVADKTGTGDFGTGNDIAVLHRPGKTPLVLTVYFTQKRKNAPVRDDVIASATRLALASAA